MVLRIALVAVVIAAGLVYVKKENVLQDAGLLGYCHRVATPVGQSGNWHECVSGKLSGKTGLTLASCTRVRTTTDADLWRCPTELESSRATQ